MDDITLMNKENRFEFYTFVLYQLKNEYFLTYSSRQQKKDNQIKMNTVKKTPIEKIVSPIQSFIKQEKSGGIVLGISVILALIFANSPLAEEYHHILEHKFGFQLDGNT